MKKLIVEQVRGRPKYLHNALHFQSDCPNLIDLRAIFSQSQGPLAPGSERQENPCEYEDEIFHIGPLDERNCQIVSLVI